ncbi:MAG: radical SAM protein, partial [Clostridia bacterium]
MQTAVSIALHTPLSGFANEFCDVLKLFFPVTAFLVNPEQNGDAEPLTHTFAEEAGVAQCAFCFRGHSAARSLTLAQVEPERRDIVYKRMRKRLCKLTLYDLLKELTGERPPWGSLTGIRPTRLFYERLAQGMSPEESMRALESEFDVSHVKADLLMRIVAEQQTLPPPAADEVDVYVSIPFCRTRCAYCSFPGEALGKGALTIPYLDALTGELEAAMRLMRGAKLKLRALYVGGGTPTALNEADFARLMDAVMLRFPGACEYTVEAGRPDTITRAKLETLKRHGIDRISINPQTMNDETLRVIGRDHTAAQTVEAFLLARELGFEDINMDVIAGLPG